MALFWYKAALKILHAVVPNSNSGKVDLLLKSNSTSNVLICFLLDDRSYELHLHNNVSSSTLMVTLSCLIFFSSGWRSGGTVLHRRFLHKPLSLKRFFTPHLSSVMHTFRITNALKHRRQESESIQILYLLHWVFDLSRERAVDTQVTVFPTHLCILDKTPRLSLMYAFDSIRNVLCLESTLLVHISICNPFKNMLFTKRNCDRTAEHNGV